MRWSERLESKVGSCPLPMLLGQCSSDYGQGEEHQEVLPLFATVLTSSHQFTCTMTEAQSQFGGRPSSHAYPKQEQMVYMPVNQSLGERTHLRDASATTAGSQPSGADEQTTATHVSEPDPSTASWDCARLREGIRDRAGIARRRLAASEIMEGAENMYEASPCGDSQSCGGLFVRMVAVPCVLTGSLSVCCCTMEACNDDKCGLGGESKDSAV